MHTESSLDAFRPVRSADLVRWRSGGGEAGERTIPEETAIALVHDAATTAVMMATPMDLEDFAIGFSLAEGVIASAGDIRDIEVVSVEGGVEVRTWLTPGSSAAHARRQRRLTGPTGCGLCGVESLAEATRPLPQAPSGGRISAAEVSSALQALTAAQQLGRETRAVHAAGLWSPSDGVRLVREDVGRHNALDKLVGAAARRRMSAVEGAVLLTSRVSVELVQKTAILGAPIIVAMSAPTALAVRTAEACGITLIAVARGDGFEVFTHAERAVI